MLGMKNKGKTCLNESDARIFLDYKNISNISQTALNLQK